jgi:hypothetical protein
VNRRALTTKAPIGTGRLPGLLLALPQDDEPFERIGLTPREFPCT